MDFITTYLQLLTELFSLVAVLAVLTVGFFLGRKWMRGLMHEENSPSSSLSSWQPTSREIYKMHRSAGARPSDLQEMNRNYPNSGWRKL